MKISEFSTIKIVLDLKYKNWKNPLKARFFIELADYLDIKTTDLNIIESIPGSVILILKLPYHSAVRLIDDFNSKSIHLKPLLKLFQIVKISSSEGSQQKEDMISRIKELELVVSIKKLKEITINNSEFENSLDELIQLWLNIERLDKSNPIEKVEFDNKSSLVKESLLVIARKIVEEYDLKQLDSLISKNQKQKLGLYDFHDIIKNRIDKNDLEGVFNILTSIDASDEQIILINSKFSLIKDQYERYFIQEEEFQILKESIKQEYLLCLSNYRK